MNFAASGDQWIMSHSAKPILPMSMDQKTNSLWVSGRKST
jgi:hypothetical protein